MTEVFRRSEKPFIWLASKSPRRKDLLEAAGYELQVVGSAFRETTRRQASPENNVQRNAQGKALQARLPAKAAGIVLAADTLVYCESEILGKPRTFKQAREMLAHIQGRMHWVYTGICLIDLETSRYRIAFERTKVFIRKFDAQAIDAIVRMTRPLDKAGAYAIQDERITLIERTEGSFSNVVGLPMELLEREIEALLAGKH